MKTFTHGRTNLEIGEHTITITVAGETVAEIFDNDQPPVLLTRDIGKIIQGFIGFSRYQEQVQ